MAHVKSKGSKLQLSIAAAYTDIPQIRSLTPPPISHEKLDPTTMDSTWEESDVAMPAGGEVICTILENPADAVHTELRTAAATETERLWKVILPSAADTESFSGHIVSWVPGELTPKGLREVTFTVQVTGAITNS